MNNLSILFFTILSIMNIYPCIADENISSKVINSSLVDNSITKKRVIKILTIDGGGIRGIIPAFILKNIEARLKRRKLSECFDIMAGTSTGGIIVLLLNVPNDDNTQKYTAKAVYNIYKTLGTKAFYQSRWQYFKTFDGWIEEKYSANNLESLLKNYFQDIKLSQSITNTFIPAYNIGANKAVFLSKHNSLKHTFNDFYMREVARATSAAPTYFKPARIKDLTNQEYLFIDGGIASNNPALDAAIHAYEIYGKDSELLIISLGTGASISSESQGLYTHSKVMKGGILHWAPSIASLLMYSSSDVVDSQLNDFFNNQAKTCYYRFQVNLEPKQSEMDNISCENLEILEEHAQNLIYEQDQKLDYIAHILDSE